MRVGVVCGGPSREAEVSRASGRQVAKALCETFPSVETFELTSEVGQQLRTWCADVVFPVLHGPPGEDGTFQGYLDLLGIPYVGSGVRASACAMDKTVAKLIFRAAGLSVADGQTVRRHEELQPVLARILDALGEDVVIKPPAEGSAIGVDFAQGVEQIRQALSAALKDHETLLVERRVAGKEITVGILERGEALEAFPVIEVVTPPGTWYDYEHRYTPGLSEHLAPAPIRDDLASRLQMMTRKAHEALGCRDLSRADFVVPDEGEPVLLEVNTLPGMTATSLYPDGAAAAGIAFPDLVSQLAQRALSRRGPCRGGEARMGR